MIAVPVFGYKSHISIDRRYGFIRAAAVTSANHPDGRMLRQVIDRENTSSEVWADSAYRSQSNEAWLADRMLTSRIHRRKPKGKSMPIATARANAVKSSTDPSGCRLSAHAKSASKTEFATSNLQTVPIAQGFHQATRSACTSSAHVMPGR